MIEYEGRFPLFDLSRIRTYPLAERPGKVERGDLASPEALAAAAEPAFASPDLTALAGAAAEARRAGRPVILFTGAHLIKNGFGPLIIDLMERGLLTLVAMNAAGMIHDLEFALAGRTSEDVPRALPAGEFGFARETGALINRALVEAERRKLGAGEALGRLIAGEAFPDPIEFPHAALSVAAAGRRLGLPVTMHASIGTDIFDMHPGWDPAAKGGASGRDFLIFAAAIEAMAGGGVFINIGSAIMGPEVLLKAASMCANVGRPPRGIVTASFDIRDADPADADDERKAGYYARDIKSVVVRIPQAFAGRGYYIQGDHLRTVPGLYQALVREARGDEAGPAAPRNIR